CVVPVTAVKAGVRRAVRTLAAARRSSEERLGCRDRLALGDGVEVHVKRPRGFPVEHHHLTRLQIELVLDKLVRGEEELDGVDLVGCGGGGQRTTWLRCDRRASWLPPYRVQRSLRLGETLGRHIGGVDTRDSGK